MKFNSILTSVLTLSFVIAFAQETTTPQGHTNQNKFRQLYNELATPNAYRTASGAPGPAYYQQQADYVMELTLNDDTQELFGDQTITYTHNSPETLSYLWLQDIHLRLGVKGFWYDVLFSKDKFGCPR